MPMTHSKIRRALIAAARDCDVAHDNLIEALEARALAKVGRRERIRHARLTDKRAHYEAQA